MLQPTALTALKLPRTLDSDPRREAIAARLTHDLRPLWEKGRLSAPSAELSEELIKSLRAVRDYRQLEIGLESIEVRLRAEKKGIEAARAKQGAAPSGRLSRLLFVASDGAERFYRATESAWAEHADRVCVVRLNATSERIGQALFGADRAIKALLVSDREGVTQVLKALS